MGKPKKWYLQDDGDGEIIICTTSGPIKKPNSSCLLGKIIKVSSPSADKVSKCSVDEAIQVCVL